jgi:hypothetical protein
MRRRAINLELLCADEDVDQINALAQRFIAKTGRPPTSIGEMAQGRTDWRRTGRPDWTSVRD